jgi:hypothetical protein
MIMETASFTGLIRALIILVLVYYGIRFLMRLLAPVIVQQVVKKAGENLFQQQQQYNTQSRQDTVKDAKPTEKKKVGEYIDYEEIE